MPKAKKRAVVKNIIVISDTHCGCQLALMPPTFQLDDGPIVSQSVVQKKIWKMWRHFWDVWVPQVTKGEPYYIVHNGDAVDGSHHGAVTQITHNIKDQVKMAMQILKPEIDNPKCAGYFHIRGTEAHVGKSAQAEEGLASALGAMPDEKGNCARWEMWMSIQGHLIHFTHHIGTTQSASYESTAVYKELVEAYTEAGRFLQEPPDMVVRSHRHRQFEIKIATKKGYGMSIVTPAWQLKTPFVYKLGMGRSSQPQMGGYAIRVGDEDGLYTRFKVWDIERPKTEFV